jgi:REP element-mobilizing transposase RayT
MQSKGWHSRGYLPHFDSPEIIQFIAFRPADSLPRSVVETLRMQDDAIRLIDEKLDAGAGACWLSRGDIAALVQDALLHFDGSRYRLIAWCLMPNHVHTIIEIVDDHSVSETVRSWKSFTARRANEILNRTGAFWHPDYFDRYMRNEGRLERTIAYVENNPVKARLAVSADDWSWSSASFRRHPSA